MATEAAPMRGGAGLAIIVAIIIVLIIFGIMAYQGSLEKTAQLSAYSDEWNDISEFREHLVSMNYKTSNILSSPTMLDLIENPSKTLFVVISVEKKYSYTEGVAIRNFVERGGRVIIADDFGYSNSVSEAFFKVSFYGKKLWDQKYDKHPSFVIIDVNFDAPQISFHSQIMLNNPTAVTSGEARKSDILASTTDKAWIDFNGNDEKDPGDADERYRRYDVIIKVSSGSPEDQDAGHAVFISDPSIFINDMWGRANNSKFIETLVQYMLPDGGEVIFDESRHIRGNVLDDAQKTAYEVLVQITTDNSLRILTGVLAVLILGGFIIGMENPKSLVHRFDLSYFVLNNLQRPDLTHLDSDRIRVLFLERLRMNAGISFEDFKELTEEDLSEMIRDPELVDFVLNWDDVYYGLELERILLKIQKWGEKR